MQNMSEVIYRSLAATTTTSLSTLITTARKATLAAAAAVVATGATISKTTNTATLASAAAATVFASSNAVSWAAQNFYDDVDVYFATAYINDSWIAISNNNSMSSGSGSGIVMNNSSNMNVNVNSSIITNKDNTTTSISYFNDINQTALINDTGVVKGVYGHINETNATIANEIQSEEFAAFIKMLVLSILLGLMILITIIGNVFVIAAIMLERNLQNVANYLVASLAVADLFVACLVMPLGAVYEISQGWILGPELCDIWTCCDVLCCTASILHLVAIASDRYWTVTNIDYTNFRTPRRVFFMILLVWLAAVVVSLAPQFGWKDPEYMERIKQQKCMVSQDVGYQIFATCSTFYVPLLVILVLYWKIYKIARKRIQRRRHRPQFSVLQSNNTNHQTEKQLKKLKKKEKKAQKLKDQQLTSDGGEQQQQQQEQQHQELLEKVNLPQKSKRQKRLKICFGLSSSAATTSEPTQIPTSIAAQPTAITITATTIATESIVVLTTTGSGIVGTTTTTTTTHGHNGVTISTATTMDCAAVSAASSTLTENRPLTALGVCIGTGPEETEYSTSNFDSKSHGTEVTTISSDADEQPTPQSNSDIITISHQLASTNCQRALAQKHQQERQQQKASDTADISLNVPAGGISSEPNSGEAGVNKLLTSIPNPLSKLAKRRQLLEARRERKAAQTLAIITGAFVVCWLPFFVMALLLPLCKDCDVDPTVASVFLWLGYFNSTLNPVIYTVFNPEFRRAFQRIVYGRNTLPHAAASRKM